MSDLTITEIQQEVVSGGAWPIRVGGVYALRDSNFTGARVTAIIGDRVYFLIRTTYSSGDHNDHGARDWNIDIFRRCYYPEDQSPIPALVEALRGFVREAEDWHHSHSHETSPVRCDGLCACIDPARAALLKYEQGVAR